MATLLAARPSTTPVPTGEIKRVYGQGGGAERAWPPNDNYFWADPGSTIPMQLGVWTKPYRYWLCANANLINRCAVASWVRSDFQLRLTNQAGNPVADLFGITFFQKLIVNESHGGGWLSGSIEGKFLLEANAQYFVQLLSKGGGANCLYYTGAEQHLNLTGWTVAEEAI